MSHVWEPINRSALGMVTADCGSAAAKICPTCGYVICALETLCAECLPHLERECRAVNPPRCEAAGCRRILYEENP